MERECEAQTRAPLAEALKKYGQKRIVSFDVPGHKQGKSGRELKDFFGDKCLALDLNASKPLDNATHPISVIREAEDLAAGAFRAGHAFFMTNGTTSAVQTMVFSVCRNGEKIIMPRNVHKSAINALILGGGVPVYVDPGVDKSLGISLGMSLKGVKEAIAAHPDAKAVFVNNPTYYGVCGDLAAIVDLAHKAGMKVLVDEAHGTHFYFHEGLPVNAMDAGADLSAVSMHKTGGSLTQSSILLMAEGGDAAALRQIINLTQTTSASYLLMASLDLARRNLALNGRALFDNVIAMTDYARKEIDKIGGYHAFRDDLCNGDSFFALDATKLSIHTRDLGLAGIEVYDLLRDEYGIQIEFGDIGNILAIISVGDRRLELERLIGALAEIRRCHTGDAIGILDHEYIDPQVALSPQKAFYAPSSPLPLAESRGRISAESVMAYPPGIPVLAPGERISADILEYIAFAKEKGCLLMGTKDGDMKEIYVVEER